MNSFFRRNLFFDVYPSHIFLSMLPVTSSSHWGRIPLALFLPIAVGSVGIGRPGSPHWGRAPLPLLLLMAAGSVGTERPETTVGITVAGVN